MDLIFDFETYSECDIRLGSYRYASDKSTRIICCAYYFGGSYGIIKEGEDFSPLFECVEKASRILAFNYFFEREIYKLLRSEKNYVSIDDTKWSCLSARCRAYGLPRGLEAAAQALNLDKGKDKVGRAALLKISKPGRKVKDRESELKKVYEYCLQDVVISKQINDIVPELSNAEKKVFELDRIINDRGIYLDILSAIKMKKYCDRYVADLNDELYRITLGTCDRATAPVKIIKYLNENHALWLTELSIGTVNSLLDNKLDEDARSILEIRKSVAKSSVKKLDFMSRAHIDGCFHGGLVYHGAHTGRWSGSGMQIQNFPRSGIDNIDEIFSDLNSSDYKEFRNKYENINHLASKMLRSFITYYSGLVWGDYSAIEARLIMWLSECAVGLNQFENNRPIYEEMAAKIYNKKVQDVTKAERHLGKTVVLGAGFGLGHKKFYESCIKQKIDIDIKLAKAAIDTFRETYHEIKSFWYGLEEAAINAVKHGDMYQYKKIKYKKISHWLFCELPSKRKLAYYKPEVKKEATPFGMKDSLTYMGVNSQTRKFERQKTYGGALAENVTQAVARDCIVNSMFELETAGYEIIFTVHDEIVALGQDAHRFKNIMEIKPAWGLDIPIKVETGEGVRYGK